MKAKFYVVFLEAPLHDEDKMTALEIAMQDYLSEGYVVKFEAISASDLPSYIVRLEFRAMEINP